MEHRLLLSVISQSLFLLWLFVHRGFDALCLVSEFCRQILARNIRGKLLVDIVSLLQKKDVCLSLISKDSCVPDPMHQNPTVYHYHPIAHFPRPSPESVVVQLLVDYDFGFRCTNIAC